MLGTHQEQWLTWLVNQFVFQATLPEQEGKPRSRKASWDQEEPVGCKVWFPPLVQPVGKKSEPNRGESLSMSVSSFLCYLFIFVCLFVCHSSCVRVGRQPLWGLGFPPIIWILGSRVRPSHRAILLTSWFVFLVAVLNDGLPYLPTARQTNH